jgi:glycerol uptake facilitator-like aquaporin
MLILASKFCDGHFNSAITVAVFVRSNDQKNHIFVTVIIICSQIAGAFAGVFTAGNIVIKGMQPMIKSKNGLTDM